MKILGSCFVFQNAKYIILQSDEFDVYVPLLLKPEATKRREYFIVIVVLCNPLSLFYYRILRLTTMAYCWPRFIIVIAFGLALDRSIQSACRPTCCFIKIKLIILCIV